MADMLWCFAVLMGVHLVLGTAGRLPQLGMRLRWAWQWLVLGVTVL